ncbi:MAG: MBL fold metallo-hydrolase [Pseudomonadota bacterium]|nr:MAG: MBL fold metallo-hydrolase [Pseudomonadota bacterium]
MRFASLGSGSRGNGTLVEADGTCVLLDCGFSVRETERRLGRLGYAGEDLTAIVVTHEHSDHVRGVAALSRKYALPIWCSHGTAVAARLDGAVHYIDVHEPLAFGALQVRPFSVPHDAREPCQFVFSDGSARLGVLTDTGMPTPHIREHLDGCEALLLEANHDPDMLALGPYPEALKARVSGNYGHLSNVQAAKLLEALDRSRLRHIVAAHLSDKNNTPALAQLALSGALGCEDNWIQIASQDAGLDWRSL